MYACVRVCLSTGTVLYTYLPVRVSLNVSVCVCGLDACVYISLISGKGVEKSGRIEKDGGANGMEDY